jgi:hypothetical protein
MNSGFEEVERCEPPADTIWTMNFADVHKSYLEYGKYVTGIHWMWKMAMDNPGEWIVYDYWEESYGRKRIYRKWSRFNEDTGIMETNWSGCPRRVGHHVGSTCSVCGMKD